MISSEAKKAINNYLLGWTKKDSDKIANVLLKNCEIVESHGPIYRGVIDVIKWMNRWFAEDYIINKWSVKSFVFINNTAVFEWIFDFSSAQEKNKIIEGISLAKFKNGKISYLREYRTTKPLYSWNKKLLKI